MKHIENNMKHIETFISILHTSQEHWNILVIFLLLGRQIGENMLQTFGLHYLSICFVIHNYSFISEFASFIAVLLVYNIF